MQNTEVMGQQYSQGKRMPLLTKTVKVNLEVLTLQ